MTRVRSRIDTGSGGYWNWTHEPDPNKTIEELITLHERCEDVAEGYRPGMPLLITRWSREGGVIHRPPPIHDGIAYFIHYVADAVRTNHWSGHIATGAPSDAGAATIVATRTSPSRAHVDVGVLAAELRELPKLAFSVGNNIIKNLARNHLTASFGLAPLMNDIKRMFEFQESLDKRLKDLRKLANEGSLSRTQSVGTYSATSFDRQYPMQSVGKFITADVTGNTTEKVWGHITWIPHDNFPTLPSAQQALAEKAIFGKTIDLATIWELIPWSWLLDWFGNAGDLIQLTRNIVPAGHGPIQIMRHKRTVYTTPEIGLNTKDGSMSACAVTIESKQRSPASPALDATLPVLTAQQMSILGAISLR